MLNLKNEIHISKYKLNWLCLIVGFLFGVSFVFIFFPNILIFEQKDVRTVYIEKEEDELTYLTDNISDYRKEKVIYLDAGHGFDLRKYGYKGEYGFATEGANGEAEYALEMIDLLTVKLEEKGYIVRRIEDLKLNYVRGSRERFGNKGRMMLFQESDCDVMIQLHYDDSPDKRLSGGHIIYGKNSLGSKTLAESIKNELKERNFRLNDMYEETDYISERNDLTVYSRYTPKPIILIECGYGCSGSMDHSYLRRKTTKDILVDSIVDGLDNYFDLFIHSED